MAFSAFRCYIGGHLGFGGHFYFSKKFLYEGEYIWLTFVSSKTKSQCLRWHLTLCDAILVAILDLAAIFITNEITHMNANIFG